MIESIPLWGSFSIIGVLVGIIVTVLIMFFRGDIVSRKAVDQVQKIADSYQKAWEISEATKQGQAEVLNKLVVSGDTQLEILRYLKARQARTAPPLGEDHGDVVE